MAEKQSKNKWHTPAERIMMLGFAAVILLGTILLCLPVSAADGKSVYWLDALFTATTSVCVTGLVTVPTATTWSTFGKIVILGLIQFGGLGIMACLTMVFLILRRKISLQSRKLIQDTYNLPVLKGSVGIVRKLLIGTAAVELAGAFFYSFWFVPEHGFWKGIGYSLFHSVSAFCNAGFDLMGVKAPFSSLTGYIGDPVVNLTIMLLIVVGGLGFLTWRDIFTHCFRFREYRLQSKLILTATAALLLFGFLFFLLYEFRLPQWAGMTLGEKVLAAMFQSVTPRTAGFNTVELTRMSEPGQLLTILLMLTGGSPGSTAGGFKTTTLAVLLLSAAAVFRKRREAQCFGRRVQDGVLQNACAIFMLYALFFLAGGILICAIDQVPLMDALFEAASAIGTVGLSLGGTARFSLASRMILIFLMYFGRVGGLTLIYAVVAGNGTSASQFPQEQVTVG